mmetsp:Transcript_82537/g.157162  ORF Transcript_82537/g.157162 Transcript_82537/m.157162 type:complete len:214 (+) Transcript_82537:1756-2397(+)
MLHVVIYSSQSMVSDVRAPHKTIQQCGYHVGGSLQQSSQDVVVALPKLVHTKVISFTVRSDGQQVVNDSLDCLNTTAIDGPLQRGDALSPDLHSKHPLGALLPRCRIQCAAKHSLRVSNDSLHDKCGAFCNCAAQYSADEPQRPTERLDCYFILCDGCQSFKASRLKRPEELDRNPVPNMSETQSRKFINHFDGIPVKLQCHFQEPFRDKMQA